MTYTEFDVAQGITEVEIWKKDIIDAFKFCYKYPSDNEYPARIFIKPSKKVAGAFFYYEGREDTPEMGNLPPEEIQLHPAFHPPPIYLSPDQFVSEGPLSKLNMAIRNKTSFQESASTLIQKPNTSDFKWNDEWSDIILEGLLSEVDVLNQYPYPSSVTSINYLDKPVPKHGREDAEEIFQKMLDAELG